MVSADTAYRQSQASRPECPDLSANPLQKCRAAADDSGRRNQINRAPYRRKSHHVCYRLRQGALRRKRQKRLPGRAGFTSSISLDKPLARISPIEARFVAALSIKSASASPLPSHGQACPRFHGPCARHTNGGERIGAAAPIAVDERPVAWASLSSFPWPVRAPHEWR